MTGFLLLISLLSCSNSVKQRFDDHISQSDADDDIVVDIEQDNEDHDEVDVAGENDETVKLNCFWFFMILPIICLDDYGFGKVFKYLDRRCTNSD